MVLELIFELIYVLVSNFEIDSYMNVNESQQFLMKILVKIKLELIRESIHKAHQVIPNQFIS